MPRFSVSVTDEQDAWVEQQAAEQDRSKSEIIRHLIDVQRRAGEADTGAVNANRSTLVNAGATADDQGATAGPSTRELAAQLERVTERLDELEAAVTDTDDGTPSEATHRDTTTAHGQDEPVGDDEQAADVMAQSTGDERSSTAQAGGSTETTDRSIPAPNEDGIIEAESRTPEDVDGSADAAAGEDGDTTSVTPEEDAEAASGSDAQAHTDAATEPDGEAGGSWPTGDSHPDPDALAQTAYSDGDDATGSPDASAGGQAPGSEPGGSDASDRAAVQPGDPATSDPDGPGGDQTADDGDLVYAAQDDATDAETVADDDAGDAAAVAADEPVAGGDSEQAVADEDVSDAAADTDGPFAEMTGDVDPDALEAKLAAAIDEPALAESVFRCWEQLRDRGTAHRRIFKSHYEDTGDGYDSPDAWWRDVSDHFEMLPGVEAPAGGGNFYRYRYNR